MIENTVAYDQQKSRNTSLSLAQQVRLFVKSALLGNIVKSTWIYI